MSHPNGPFNKLIQLLLARRSAQSSDSWMVAVTTSLYFAGFVIRYETLRAA